jgi:hypothetical protein
MNGIPKWIWFVLAFALATITFPAVAAKSQNKTYRLNVCVGTLDVAGVCTPSAPSTGTAPTPVQARLTNTSPAQSNSTINSVDLFADLSWSIDGTVPSVFETGQPSVLYTADTSQPGHIKVTNLNPLKPGDSLNINFAVSQFSCGDGNWSQSLIWSGANLGGNTFIMDAPPKSAPVANVACSIASCSNRVIVQPNLDYCDTTSDEGIECIIGMRGPSNKDGSACSSLPIYVSNYVPPKETVHFRWLQDAATGTSAAVFNYRINTPATSTPPADVAWIEDANGNPIEVPSLQCNATPAFLASALPQQLGTLAGDVNGSKKLLKVDASVAASAPPNFEIVIGTEMMLVTNISSGNWTVTRGYGNTTATGHSATDPVMYSPLPIIPNAPPFNTTFAHTGYAPNNHAHMCYTLFGTNPVTGTKFTDVIDIGDGWVLGR